MARDKITTYSIGLNGISASAITPVSLDDTNGGYAEYPEDGVVYVVTNTTSGESADDIVLTIKGNTGDADDDKTITVGDGDTVVIGNFESARYKQSDGSIYFNADADGLTMYGIYTAI